MGRVLQPFEYFEPTSVADAITLLAEPGAKVLAGGCELVLGLRRGTARHARLVSIMKVDGLSTFRAHPKVGVEVGALVKIRTLENDIWLAKRWGALHESLEQLHPPQIHNMGTVVGNVCAAVPYYDVPTALVALRASLRIQGPRGEREVPIESFYVAPGRTVVKADEIVTAMLVPPPAPDASSAFKKILKAKRREGDLHKVNAAAYVALDTATDRVAEATVAIGCCVFKPVRVAAAEAALTGAPATTASFTEAAAIAARSVEPMTGAPWIEEIRRDFVHVLVRDVLEQAASRARSKHDPFDDADSLI
jgi:aerobic carbon-monoxide dehydrogenase medium subunit